MYVVLKPKTFRRDSEDYGTLDAIVLPSTAVRFETGGVVETTSWMPFDTFDEAYAYLRDELAPDPRYFIFELVGTEYGRLPKE